MGFFSRSRTHTDPSTARTPRELGEAGGYLADHGYHPQAIQAWSRALHMLPADDETAWWYFSCIADSAGELGDWVTEENCAQHAIALGATDNPLVWYRLGQARFETGRHPEAVDPFMSAYMINGTDVFEGGEKYLTFLGAHMPLGSEALLHQA